MSGWLLKKVLKEHEEESKRQNHLDEEEGDLGGRSSINPLDLLNEGDEDPDSEKETEIDDEEKKKQDEYADNVQPPTKESARRRRRAKRVVLVWW
ncbi:hypothetical protein Bca4012_029474 [Brassica carinata]